MARKPRVEATEHDDKRSNIPTSDLSDFVSYTEGGVARYERDLALDPQLVWKGKDSDDLDGYLDVNNVPIYIQEKIDPRVVVENLRDTAGGGRDEPEYSLFDDFDGLEFDQLVDFYKHPGNWSNRLILGDSQLVMNSLAEKENLSGKVQMIYIDPPYGIKFGSNWQVSTRKRSVKDGKGTDVTRQPEQVKAFRDTWELGIHSYLRYLRDRLTVARELLTESGSCFLQIGDENVHLVRSLMDEVFGSENFVSLITFKKTSAVGSFSGGTTALAGTCDYLIWYAKSRDLLKYRQLYLEKDVDGSGGAAYRTVEEPDGRRRPLSKTERTSGVVNGRILRASPMTSDMVREAATTVFPVELDGKTFDPGTKGWKTNRSGMERLRHANRLMASGSSLAYVRYIDDFPAFPITNLWNDTQSGSAMEKTYVVQTNQKVIERCMLMTTDPGDLVLDPTCGSGTTAVVAEQWGRRWITTDTSRVATALTRTRLMSAKFPYYLLADSPEGADAEAKTSGSPRVVDSFGGDIKKGFVYKRVPHVTLKSIAQNPDIREGLSRKEIDSAISKHAESEVLVDQPFEDKKRVRVTGRFTVESLSPHRTLDSAVDEPESEKVAGNDSTFPGFTQTILDNLRKTGVQNTYRDEKLKLDRLDFFAGTWIQAEGEFTDSDGEVRSVAISLGPEHSTVGSEQVKEAAKEALKGRGFDLLLICGFAFDARVSETAKEFSPTVNGFEAAAEERRLGKLRMQMVKMNPDLAMGGDLLKKTGAGNLFMIFGEPDVAIKTEGEWTTVEILGLDVYDPTTGVVRSSSTKDIACWFIDSNYNGESFFVRHAYFVGDGDPYKQLRRALKAEVDEDAWSTLNSTVSRPFLNPSTGRIAVKVINHYGDEVLKVYDVE